MRLQNLISLRLQIIGSSIDNMWAFAINKIESVQLPDRTEKVNEVLSEMRKAPVTTGNANEKKAKQKKVHKRPRRTR